MTMSDHRPLLWIDGQPFNYVREIPRGVCRACQQDRSGMDGYQGVAPETAGEGAGELTTYCPECAAERSAA